MFVKRRRAVVALAILAVFFYGAIWAPLLASGIPLHFRGYDRAPAEKAWRLAHLESASLSRGLGGRERPPREKTEKSFEVVAFQLERLERGLAEAPAARVRQVRERLARAREAWAASLPGPASAAPPADPAAAATLKDLAAEIKAKLNPAEAGLRRETRWLAFRALHPPDAGLMALSLSALAAIPWMRSRPGRPRRPRAAAAVALVPALLAAGGWGLLVDRFEDPTDYKGGIRAGTIVAEAVTYPPVAFGLNENDLSQVVQPPSPEHALGTDESGRDTLCRLLWGSRISLSVGFVAVGIYVLLGTVIGAVAGFFGGWTDILISRFIEWVICFPTFFLILVISAFLQERTVFGWEPPQLLVIMVVIGVTGWPSVARLVRAEFLRLVGQDFVLAARALGTGQARIIFGHVLPNALAPVFVTATFGVAGAILTESALSFLGLGIKVPNPSWGGMLNAAHGYEPVSGWIFLWPGLAIFLVITCYNLVGEALRDALDPRLRQ